MKPPLRRFCLACDLHDDPDLIKEYIAHHESANVWPEVKESLKEAGIIKMQIHLIANRLFMILDVDESFSLEKKQAMDLENEKVQSWEAKMWKYQAGLPWAPTGIKWMQMEKVFELD